MGEGEEEKNEEDEEEDEGEEGEEGSRGKTKQIIREEVRKQWRGWMRTQASLHLASLD